ncbi:MAG: DPP IV N-terminal domain-containing protein [bacterium]
MASPIAHSLTGIGIYWTSIWKQRKPSDAIAPKHIIGAVSAIILANLSDADLLATLISRSYLHHQLSHTLLFALSIAAVSALIAPIFGMKRTRVFTLTFLLAGSHIFIDFLTGDRTYPKGCMLFWPLSNRYFISPIPIFQDIWRGSTVLIFGFNNFYAAVRELAIGGCFMLVVNRVNPLPNRIVKPLFWITLTTIVLTIAIHTPLQVKAHEQMLSFWEAGTPVTDTQMTKGILFTSKKSGNSDIYRIQPDGNGLVQLTHHPGEDLWPVWSPDGQWIAFQSDRDGKMDIWIMKADGSDKRNLTARSNAMNESPSWTPEGNQIVFCSDREGQLALYVMGRKGISISRITPKKAGRCILPAVSPVRGEIVYTEDEPGKPGWHISAVSLNKGAPKRIGLRSGCRAKWSPDGKDICFVSEGAENITDIYIYSMKEEKTLQATYSKEYDYDPCYSPDGNRLCFARGKNGRKTNWDLWIIDLDTGKEIQLTSDGMDNRYPSWR